MNLRSLHIPAILFSCLMAAPALRGESPEEKRWTDSVFGSLTPSRRIAQLLVIRAWSDRDSSYNDSLTRIIARWNVGGVCFFKGTPRNQVLLVNRWQETAQTPLLVAIDAEWGLGMRLDSAWSFPRPMMLGATGNDSLAYRVGLRTAAACRRTGIYLNLAPVADINNNPLNPVINVRSFGEDRHDVTRMSLAFMKGLRDGGVFASAKHFPGHGDTDTDSHLSLPLISHPKARLDSMELYPFRELIRNGVTGIMIAHLYIPSIDSSGNTASTLSEKVVTGLLKQELQFKGFVITDALDMSGVTKYYAPGEIEVKALQAGNDILLLPQDVEKAVKAITAAADSGRISWDTVNGRCRRMLGLKFRAGLSHPVHTDTGHLYRDLNTREDTLLTRAICRSAVTLLKNSDELVPLKFLDRRKIAIVTLGDSTVTPFQKVCGQYAPVTFFNLPGEFGDTNLRSLLNSLQPFNLAVIALQGTSSYPSKQYGIRECELKLLDTLAGMRKIILVSFAPPYGLSMIRNLPEIPAILEAYQDLPGSQEAAAAILFGGIPAKGRLPVTATPLFPLHTGIATEKSRLEFTLPEEAGIPAADLRVIDSIAVSGIREGAYPGCQVLFAHKGRIFYNRAFGRPTYSDSVAVRTDDLYDLASVTKVAATTLAVMKLYETGKISPDSVLATYLPELKGSNKAGLTIREVMAHQAGLQPWIPFYRETLKDGKPDPLLFRYDSSAEYPIRVAQGLYLREGYPDTIFGQIIRSPLLKEKTYKYSDLGFYLLGKIVGRVSGLPLDRFMERNFYAPLGLNTLCFRPLERFPADRILPTEQDDEFRGRLLRGDVHDPGAALLGGVAGHAGLFSDAADLAVLLQMLISYGAYGDKQYLLPSTIREFTRVQYPGTGNRRGLGFDKPIPGGGTDGPACESAAPGSFGHSGFTGTYIWADPENQLVYVFLSNRVHPDATNQKLAALNIRTALHEAMYRILEKNGLK